MTSFSKILVPTDFSDCANVALDRALELPRPIGGSVTLLHVYEMPPIYPSGPIMSAETITAAENAARAELEKAKERASRRLKERPPVGGVPEITTKLIMGGPLGEILEEARQGQYDLIVIGTHGRTGLKHFFLGSVAERVIRAAPCPVLTVRPELEVGQEARVAGQRR